MKVSLEEFKKKLNNYYTVLEYNGMTKPAKFLCPKHGIIIKTPKNFLIHSCNKCSKEIWHKKISKSNEDFINEAKNIFPNYDYNKVDYYNWETKITVICPEHGEFNIIPNSLLQGHGCPKCSKRKEKYTLADLIKRANLIHNNKYNYSLADKTGISSEVKIICPEHGVFNMTWNNHINCYQGCPECNSNLSFGEIKIITFLNKNKIDYIYEKKYDDLFDEKQLSYDFYLSDYNILIEFQGQQHYYNSFHKPVHEWHKQLHHDWLKRKYAKDHNIKLLTISYKDVNIISSILMENIKCLKMKT